MAGDLLFILKKKLPSYSPDPEQIGGNYHVVHGESLLPTVELGPGEEVLASIQSGSCTLVLTNARVIRKQDSGVSWGGWWDIENFAYPIKDVFPEGDAYGA